LAALHPPPRLLGRSSPLSVLASQPESPVAGSWHWLHLSSGSTDYGTASGHSRAAQMQRHSPMHKGGRVAPRRDVKMANIPVLCLVDCRRLQAGLPVGSPGADYVAVEPALLGQYSDELFARRLRNCVRFPPEISFAFSITSRCCGNHPPSHTMDIKGSNPGSKTAGS
jgi:hypothetical protein